MLATKTDELVGEDFVFVVLCFLELGFNSSHCSAGNNFLNTRHKGQLGDSVRIVVSSLNANRIEPTRFAENLCGIGVYRIDITVVQRIVADVVKVGTALLVTLDSLRIKVGVGVELCVVFVGEEHVKNTQKHFSCAIATVETRAKTAMIKFFLIKFEICCKGMVLFSTFVPNYHKTTAYGKKPY